MSYKLKCLTVQERQRKYQIILMQNKLSNRIFQHAFNNYHIDKWKKIYLIMAYGASVNYVLRGCYK